MKRFSLSICGMVLALSAPSVVFADTLFNFSFETSGVHGNPGTMISGSGQLDLQATGTPDTFLIEGITGFTESGSIYGAISGITGGVGDLLSIAGGVGTLGTGGISYLLNNGASVGLSAGSLTPIFPFPGNTLVTLSNSNPFASEVGATYLYVTPASPTTAATPEPGTLVLLATGGLGLIGRASGLRRRLRRRD